MGLFADRDLRLAEQIAALAYANPFLEERIAHEQAILGDSYVASQEYWSLLPDLERKANIDLIAARTAELVESLTERREGGVRLADNEVRLHDDVVIYFLYDRYREALFDLVDADAPSRVSFYPRFAADVSRYLSDRIDAAHLFACFYQVRRAFHHIFRFIIGRSPAAAQLRGRIWESIFTHDMRRYRRALYLKMADVPTLVTGPTGTGKELVARAIGLSRYIPFDASRERFARAPSSTFVGLNLSALSPTLIESELFGHRKGAFTGAIADREGYLESCGAFGTVFLDEIGEVDPAVQVKLLRVIQSRTLNRLGDSVPRSFGGKLIAATNRDLSAEIRKGAFREDFYYRLCADTIVTPSLHEQMRSERGELAHLVRFVCTRVAGDEEAGTLAVEVLRAIDASPGIGYQWPGNFRELEQCARSVMLRGSYEPPARRAESGARQRIADGMMNGAFTADELLRNYCTLLYAASRNYSHVAERAGIDRRTVRARIDPALLDEL
jgi:DNA-binding NtrC family response regulator